MKKNQKLKRRLIGMLLGILIGILMIPTAFAVSGKISQTLTYRNIKINLDGQVITPKDANGKYVEPFAIEGTTYLPVRAIAGALGLNVGWDSPTSTVVLTTPKAMLPASDTFFHMQAARFDSEPVVNEKLDNEYFRVRYKFVLNEDSLSAAVEYLIMIMGNSTAPFTLDERIELDDTRFLFLLEYDREEPVTPIVYYVDNMQYTKYSADLMVEVWTNYDKNEVSLCIYYDEDSYRLFDEGSRSLTIPQVKTGIQFYDLIHERVYDDRGWTGEDNSDGGSIDWDGLSPDEDPCTAPYCRNGRCTECDRGKRYSYVSSLDRWMEIDCMFCDSSGNCTRCGGDGIDTAGRIG